MKKKVLLTLGIMVVMAGLLLFLPHSPVSAQIVCSDENNDGFDDFGSDKDTDGFDDCQDFCPYEGYAVTGDIDPVGCPIPTANTDSDFDGIPDMGDWCPFEPRAPGMENGCPDSDGDGIDDLSDGCPYEYSTANGGCPVLADADGDGFPDVSDTCPRDYAPATARGCPDPDGDGFDNAADKCPTQYSTTNNGCPPVDTDRDKDGILNEADKCPDNNASGSTFASNSSYFGCPDSDRDLVPDNADKCPTTAANTADGCPVNVVPPTPLPPAATCQIIFTGRITFKGPGTNYDIQNPNAQPGTYDRITARSADGLWWAIRDTDWIQGSPVNASICNALPVRSVSAPSSARSNPAGECTANDSRYLATRLAVGRQARTTPNGLSQNLRQDPDTNSTLVTTIPPGGVFDILAGPRCGQNPKKTSEYLRWWQVRYNGYTGWTPESNGKDYWIEPYSATTIVTNTTTLIPPTTTTLALPSNRVAIASSNGTQVGEIGRFTQDPAQNLDLANNGTLAVGSLNGIYFFNSNGANLTPLSNQPLQQSQVFLAISPDGTRYLTAYFTQNPSLELQNVTDPTMPAVWAGLGNPLKAIITPDGTTLIVLSTSVTDAPSPGANRIALLGLTGSSADITLDYPGTIFDAVVSPNSQQVALITADPNANVFLNLMDIAARQITLAVSLNGTKADSGQIVSSPMTFDRMGTILAVGTFNGDLQILDTKNLTIIHNLTQVVEGSIMSIAFSPTSDVIAIGTVDGTIALIDPVSGLGITLWTVGAPENVTDLAFSPDGALLFALSGNKNISVWGVKP